MNSFPRNVKTKFLINRMSFSYLNNLYMIIFWKISNFNSNVSGNLTSKGFYYSKIFLQIASLSLLINSFNTFLNGAVTFDKSMKSL